MNASLYRTVCAQRASSLRLLLYLAKSFRYFPIDLGTSSHPPLHLTLACPRVHIVNALGGTSTRDLLRDVHRVFPHRCAERW
jgi:hypothetical protein